MIIFLNIVVALHYMHRWILDAHRHVSSHGTRKALKSATVHNSVLAKGGVHAEDDAAVYDEFIVAEFLAYARRDGWLCHDLFT